MLKPVGRKKVRPRSRLIPRRGMRLDDTSDEDVSGEVRTDREAMGRAIYEAERPQEELLNADEIRKIQEELRRQNTPVRRAVDVLRRLLVKP